MQAASAEASALKFEAISRWASSADTDLNVEDEAPVALLHAPAPMRAAPRQAARTHSERDQSHAALCAEAAQQQQGLYEPRLAEDGALHPGVPASRTFSVPGGGSAGGGGGGGGGGGDAAAAAPNDRARSPDPLWGGPARPASPAQRSQQASPTIAEQERREERLRAVPGLEYLRRENERLAAEEAAREPFGSLPTVGQYLATSPDFEQRNRATMQADQQRRYRNAYEHSELERLRRRSAELETSVQSSYIQAGTFQAELDHARRATMAAEERCRVMQRKLDQERKAVQRLTSRPSPAKSSAPPAASPTRSARRERTATAEGDGGASSPFTAAREELVTLQRTATLFSDTESDLAKSVARVAELEAIVREKDTELSRKDQSISEKDEQLRNQEADLRERDDRLAKLASGMRALMREAESS